MPHHLLSPQDITDATFASFVASHPRVVVDAWAEWCIPCKRIEPSMQELARDYGGAVAFARLDTDANPATASRLGVMSMPTLYLYRDGRLVGQIVGALPKPQIKARIEESLAP